MSELTEHQDNKEAIQETDQEKMICDSGLSISARAEMMLLWAREDEVAGGIPLFEKFIKRLDTVNDNNEITQEQNARLLELYEAIDNGPLVPETFISLYKKHKHKSALLASTGGIHVMPLMDLHEEAENYKNGDTVMVSQKAGCVAHRDKDFPITGEVVSVKDIDIENNQITISKKEDSFVAYASNKAIKDPNLKPGCQVVWDPKRTFVHQVLKCEETGEDLLLPADELPDYTLDKLGDPNPAIFSIFDEIKQKTEHPDWANRLQVTNQRSYLFWGPTGTGKSTHIKVLMNMVGEWVQEKTGVYAPRVVFVDASDFLSPWYGESDQKIHTWFRKLHKIAKTGIEDKNGREIKVPTVVVIEEIEGLVRRRGSKDSSSHLYDRTLSTILKNMESADCDSNLPITFICTTNRKEVIDSAAQRRFGDRQVLFPNLGRNGAMHVLEKKMPENLPTTNRGTHESKLSRIISHVFENDTPLATVTMMNRDEIHVLPQHLVSGAVIESAVNKAKDKAMLKSQKNKRFSGVDIANVTEAMDEHFDSVAQSLSVQNVADYAPQLFGSTNDNPVVAVNRAERS